MSIRAPGDFRGQARGQSRIGHELGVLAFQRRGAKLQLSLFVPKIGSLPLLIGDVLGNLIEVMLIHLVPLFFRAIEALCKRLENTEAPSEADDKAPDLRELPNLHASHEGGLAVWYFIELGDVADP